MGRVLSQDPRDRVVAAVKGGMSCRQAAVHFGVSAASAIRWRFATVPRPPSGKAATGAWKTTTLIAGLRRTGMVASMGLDGPINRDAFRQCPSGGRARTAGRR